MDNKNDNFAAKRVKKRCCALTWHKSNLTCYKSSCCRLQKVFAKRRTTPLPFAPTFYNL